MNHPDARGRDELHRPENWTVCEECGGEYPTDYDDCPLRGCGGA